MLSIKGMYDGNIIVLLAKINKRANTPVIITFLDEDLSTDESNVIKDIEEKYQTLSKSHAPGTTLAEAYDKEIKPNYYETISIPLDTDIAQIYTESSGENKKKMRLLLNLCLREFAMSPRPLKTIMDDISKKAQERGLTPEILESLLRTN